MKLPTTPTISPIVSITPSFYNAALRCKAQAAWSRFGDRRALPGAPSSVLGSAFHGVTEAAARGQLPDQAAERRIAAYTRFDEQAERLLSEAHPHLRRRFPVPAEIPYYYLTQARAAEAAVTIRTGRRGHSDHPARLAEKRLHSRDGAIVGRVDLIDLIEGTVYDYKSGAEPEERITEVEARQLRLYVYLCRDNDIPVEKGVIVRSSGRRDALDVPADVAYAEAEAARSARADFNRSAHLSFEKLAQPSPQVCGRCPCMPMCDPFWAAATPQWAEEAGCHVEGVIETVDRKAAAGTELISLRLSAMRGTVGPGPTATDRLPAWTAEADGSGPLQPGQTIRIVGAGMAPGSSSPIRMHRSAGTALWRVSPVHTDGMG